MTLPNWTDTSHCLTLWQRRGATPTTPSSANSDPLSSIHPSPPKLIPASCLACGLGMALPSPSSRHVHPGSGGVPPSSREVIGGLTWRRCRLCREAVYCSTACAISADGRTAHARVHAQRLIWDRLQTGTQDQQGDFLVGALFEDFLPFGASR